MGMSNVSLFGCQYPFNIKSNHPHKCSQFWVKLAVSVVYFCHMVAARGSKYSWPIDPLAWLISVHYHVLAWCVSQLYLGSLHQLCVTGTRCLDNPAAQRPQSMNASTGMLKWALLSVNPVFQFSILNLWYHVHFLIQYRKCITHKSFKVWRMGQIQQHSSLLTLLTFHLIHGHMGVATI